MRIVLQATRSAEHGSAAVVTHEIPIRRRDSSTDTSQSVSILPRADRVLHRERRAVIPIELL